MKPPNFLAGCCSRLSGQTLPQVVGQQVGIGNRQIGSGNAVWGDVETLEEPVVQVPPLAL